ncbi:MAG: sulfotransferase [Dokdonella sp.]
MTNPTQTNPIQTDQGRQQRPIFVLGMHRSGTSAVARVLGLMGVLIGNDEDLLPAHPTDNPTGYWERADVYQEHERFLAASGFAWDKLAGFASDQVPSDARNELISRITPIADKLSQQGNPWLLKDPRLGLVLPQWRTKLPDPVYVVVVRDPREIAVSLASSHRGQYPSHFLLALWEKYLRVLLDSLEGNPAIFVSYQALLDQPETQSLRLLDFLRKSGISSLIEPSAHELNGFLDVRLRRSRVNPLVELNEVQESLQQWLVKQCRSASAVDVVAYPLAEHPDGVLLEYQSALIQAREEGRTHALLTLQSRLELVEVSLREQQQVLVTSVEGIAAKNIELEQLRGEHSALHAQADQMRCENSDLHERLMETVHANAELQAAVERSAAQLTNVSMQAANMTAHAERLTTQSVALQSSLSWRITAPLRWIVGRFSA